MTTLGKLRTEARTCQACPLWEHATQTVFGAGPADADVMLVGEQPGDQEDLQGKPFVGPAGQLLDRALEEAGIDRKRVYVTNAVKHFKWIKQGKRRLHKKPSAREVAACNQWLQQEIDTLQPKLIVCLGATAATTLLGASFKVTMQRGKLIQGEGARRWLATVHPSSILRARVSRLRGRYSCNQKSCGLIAARMAAGHHSFCWLSCGDTFTLALSLSLREKHPHDC